MAPLQSSLNSVTSLQKQFFGKSQLKLIFNACGDKLTASDVQESINQFLYGLNEYILEEPYKSMKNPAAVLFEHLKNGDIWQDPRFFRVNMARI